MNDTCRGQHLTKSGSAFFVAQSLMELPRERVPIALLPQRHAGQASPKTTVAAIRENFDGPYPADTDDVLPLSSAPGQVSETRAPTLLAETSNHTVLREQESECHPIELTFNCDRAPRADLGAALQIDQANTAGKSTVHGEVPVIIGVSGFTHKQKQEYLVSLRNCSIANDCDLTQKLFWNWKATFTQRRRNPASAVGC
jgi:hypothetical protein